MMIVTSDRFACAARGAALASALAAAATAQHPHQAGAPHAGAPHAWAGNWVVPSRAVLAPPGVGAVRMTGARAHVAIRDRAATTTVEVDLHNPTSRPQESVLLLPVPDGASVSGFSFEGAASEPQARVLPVYEARRLYDEITRRMKDPALLEFAGYGCVRSSVFPVPAGGRQKVRLVFDHVLEVRGDRVDYELPRSELLAFDVPWQITVDLAARADIGICYSPSHALDVTRRGGARLTARVAAASERDPGAFELSYTTVAADGRPTASLFAYPDPAIGGGWFLLLASAPQPPAGSPPLRREVTLVLDRSGSMAGRKLEQAKAAALQVLEGLADGEGIQVIHYGNDVTPCFASPVAKSDATMQRVREFVAAIRPHGGTNIHDALVEALRPPPRDGALPLVLFLTDGLPTVGPTSERDLHRVIAAGNAHGRRVFCFGVGHDVNVPLLDHVAESTRAVANYVRPDEDVEVAVADTFARLDRPVLAGPTLRTVDADGAPLSRTSEVLPRQLPDLYAGDQLVVLGQYRGEADLRFELAGRTPAGPRRYAFALPVASASTRHAFVPRLWASRQIAFLVDELRQQGGDLGAPPGQAVARPFDDPRLRELRDEILRLSTRFGVLGEYTAFLAREGHRLDDWNALTGVCEHNLQRRAIATRSGVAAVNQAQNLWFQRNQRHQNVRNAYVDERLDRVQLTTIQQVGGRAFYRRGDRWIDGTSVLNRDLAPAERVAHGTARWREVLARMRAAGIQVAAALQGEVLVHVDGRNVLLLPPAATPDAPGQLHDPNTRDPQEVIR